MRTIVGVLAGLLMAGPAIASTFYDKTIKCPVGGERFVHQSLGSITTWGAAPDGMPMGSGTFPIVLPQCPGNGLVLYENFDAAKVKRLTSIVISDEYRALRGRETRYYLAYWLAKSLGDVEKAPWLLLSATWEAKNKDAAGEQAHRYAGEFVEMVRTMPVSDTDFTSIALRARAANALRELGRFDDAEALRSSIVIAPNAGGDEEQAADNREGWSSFLRALAKPIARRENGRMPIDMVGDREAVFRCLEPEDPEIRDAAPLTPFERDYCAQPDIATSVAKMRGIKPENP
ncbi:hypothetical protein [Sphingomonas colocasiae]|uniref:Tetratricopeptide repeat protein n=1 Tax=Sphingomonas colocasiae TaxID=1848973 RepID=A0ABS7PN19_9SPHN|nr:hypothetical protein [Sphingomonas colocasiae]MBY8822716.1 hypothetical protein [Sphingomonas colocasiae]